MRTLALTVSLLWIPIISAAATYVVKPDGTGDFPTIQDAIDAAVDGDVIGLANGWFTGDGNRDIDYLGKAITVRSLSRNPAACVIDCQGSETDPHRGFLFHSGETPDAVLEGVRIMKGWMEDYYAGGGIGVSHASPTIRNCAIVGNSAVGGGGVVISWGSAPVLENCIISENQCRYFGNGGGLSCESHSPIIRGCLIEDNTTEELGGGIYFSGAQLVLQDCIIRGNSAWRGGGIDFDDTSLARDLNRNGGSRPDTLILVENCLFEGNHSEIGGAFFCEEIRIAFSGCTFIGNSATYGGGAGASHWDASPHMTRCFFAHNSAGSGGGALASGYDGIYRGCTFLENSAPQGGGLALSLSDFASCSLENTVIAFSVQGEALHCDGDDTDSLIVACCDLYGNAGGDWVGCLAGQEGVAGNFSADPLFCLLSPSDAISPFKLHADSPCLPGNHPYGYDCGLIGAHNMGCGPAIVEEGVTHVSDAHGADLWLEAVPNPFLTSVTIRYSLPAGRPAVVSVFDISGRQIWTYTATAPGGVVTWDGRNASGDPAAAGIYFIRLDSPERKETRQVQLVR